MQEIHLHDQLELICDKLFLTTTVHYDDKLKTSSRPDVCDDLFNSVQIKLLKDGYSCININEIQLKILNRLIY